MSPTTAPAAELILTWTGEAFPEGLCCGHRGPAPAGQLLGDQDGYLWCTECAQHMITCTDKDCDHPTAAPADQETELRIAVREFSADQQARAFAAIRAGAAEVAFGATYKVRSSDGTTLYMTDEYGCNCPRGRRAEPCYHRAMVLMLEIGRKYGCAL